jgi:hypothetical protein
VGSGSTLQQVTLQRRPAKSIFESEPGKLHALQVAFDPQTQLVTVTLSVEDPEGYFIPNLRREHFAVYEDGVVQKNATVDIDHAAVSMSVLLEGSGRYQELNQMLRTEIPSVAHPPLNALIPDDKVAVFAYANAVKLLGGRVIESPSAKPSRRPPPTSAAAPTGSFEKDDERAAATAAQ